MGHSPHVGRGRRIYTPRAPGATHAGSRAGAPRRPALAAAGDPSPPIGLHHDDALPSRPRRPRPHRERLRQRRPDRQQRWRQRQLHGHDQRRHLDVRHRRGDVRHVGDQQLLRLRPRQRRRRDHLRPRDDGPARGRYAHGVRPRERRRGGCAGVAARRRHRHHVRRHRSHLLRPGWHGDGHLVDGEPDDGQPERDGGMPRRRGPAAARGDDRGHLHRHRRPGVVRAALGSRLCALGSRLLLQP